MSFVADLTALVHASSDGRLRCPPHWTRAPLGSVADITNGFPFSSAAFGTVGAPVIRIRDVTRGSTETRFAGPVPEGYWVERGDLLIGMDGDFASAFWCSDRAVLNQRVCKLTPKSGTLDRRYLGYVLPAYLQLINDNTPSVTVKHLSSRTLAAVSIPLPDIEVQRRLADRIDELFIDIDDGEAALERARGDLATWRKALLKAAVTGELTTDWRAANPPTETGADLLTRILAERRTRWLAEPRNRGKRYVDPVRTNTAPLAHLPGGWTWTDVQQLSTVVRGASPRPAGDPRYFGGNVPWITVGSLTRDQGKFLRTVDLFVTEAGRQRSRYIEADTLLFTNSGATLGVPKITKIGGCINDGSVALLGLDEPLRSYLYYYLRTQTERLRNLNQGAAQPNLNTSIVKEIPVPLPPTGEMKEIVTVLDSQDPADLQLAELAEAAASAASLRQSILAAAFRGDLVA